MPNHYESDETVAVRVTNAATGLELGRFLVPPDHSASIVIEQGPGRVVLYIPGVDVPVVFIGAARVVIERRRGS